MTSGLSSAFIRAPQPNKTQSPCRHQPTQNGISDWLSASSQALLIRYVGAIFGRSSKAMAADVQRTASYLFMKVLSLPRVKKLPRPLISSSLASPILTNSCAWCPNSSFFRANLRDAAERSAKRSDRDAACGPGYWAHGSISVFGAHVGAMASLIGHKTGQQVVGVANSRSLSQSS